MPEVPDDFLTPEDAQAWLRRMQDEIDRLEWLADHPQEDDE